MEGDFPYLWKGLVVPLLCIEGSTTAKRGLAKRGTPSRMIWNSGWRRKKHRLLKKGDNKAFK